ncbi:MAG: UDP-N-acetylmuramate--L-alanine ligase [Pseudanabaenaceae cyanobacterium]
MQDLGNEPFHFIGIGGIGMSGIAHILVKRGYQVSGSDLQPNRVTAQLAELGVKIYWGQSAQNINLHQHPQVVYSSAIKQGNPELETAIKYGLKLWHRAELLAELVNHSQSVAVSGTHGKTTTSSLISFLLLRAGFDPTIVVGGEVDAWGGNARAGHSPYLVAEADESDGSLVKFHPQVGVITNVELDHTDHYQNLEQVVGVFQQFATQAQVVVTCGDCPVARRNIKASITYSLNGQPTDYTVKAVSYCATGTTAILVERGKVLGEFQLQLLGAHNLSNALAAIAVARYYGIDWELIREALPAFRGAKRRFEAKGEWQGITLVDDYAHHPSEVQATLRAAKLQGRRVVAVFQPHRYSRTYAFFTEFTAAFAEADVVVVTEIYSAGEEPIAGVSAEQLATAIAQVHPRCIYLPKLAEIPPWLQANLQTGDLVLFLGAGNLNQVIAPTLELLQHAS